MARLAGLILSAPLLLATASVVLAQADAHFDRAVGALREATEATATGEHLRRLDALRELRDPALEPLFSALSQHTNSLIRVNGILGVAELADPPRVDPWKLRQLESLPARSLAVGEAIRLELAGPEEMRRILEWSDLEAELEISLLLVLISRGEEVETARLRAHLESESAVAVRARAALLLRAVGETEGTEEALAELLALPSATREQNIASILSNLRSYPVAAMGPWLTGLLEEEGLSDDLQQEILATLFAVDAKAAVGPWRARWNPEDSLAQRLRAALTLFQYAEEVEGSAFEALRADSEALVRTIGEAGAAFASDSGVVEAAEALIARDYQQGDVLLLQHALEQEEATAAELLEALIRDVLAEERVTGTELDLCRRAATELMTREPARLGDLAATARVQNRRLALESLLLGAYVSDAAETGALIGPWGNWPTTRSQSLAALIKGRYLPGECGEADLAGLSLIFRGAGSVPPELEMQAAWLYLKILGRENAALAVVLAPQTPARSTPNTTESTTP